MTLCDSIWFWIGNGVADLVLITAAIVMWLFLNTLPRKR